VGWLKKWLKKYLTKLYYYNNRLLLDIGGKEKEGGSLHLSDARNI
jgi:hypothetical protein